MFLLYYCYFILSWQKNDIYNNSYLKVWFKRMINLDGKRK